MYTQSRKIGKTNNIKSHWEQDNRRVYTGYQSSVTVNYDPRI